MRNEFHLALRLRSRVIRFDELRLRQRDVSCVKYIPFRAEKFYRILTSSQFNPLYYPITFQFYYTLQYLLKILIVVIKILIVKLVKRSSKTHNSYFIIILYFIAL